MVADTVKERAEAIAAKATTTLTVEYPTVQQALSKVMAELPNIGKDSQAPPAMGGFQFRGIEAIAGAVRPLLAKYGVVIAPQARITQVVHAPGQKEMWQDVYLEVDWLITGPDGSQMTARTCGIGRDHTDKGANKAQSQAYKYLLLHLFCIADARDDSDSHDYSNAVASEPVLPDGWESWAQLEQTWKDLKKWTAELPDTQREEAQAELRKLGFTRGTFTPEHAEAWRTLLPAEPAEPAAESLPLETT